MDTNKKAPENFGIFKAITVKIYFTSKSFFTSI